MPDGAGNVAVTSFGRAPVTGRLSDPNCTCVTSPRSRPCSVSDTPAGAANRSGASAFRRGPKLGITSTPSPIGGTGVGTGCGTFGGPTVLTSGAYEAGISGTIITGRT